MKRVLLIVVVLAAFALFDVGAWHLDLVQWVLAPWLRWGLGHYLAAKLVVVTPLLLALWALHGWRRIPAELGLNGNAAIGFAVAALCTAPMFAGYGWMAGAIAPGVTFASFVAMSLAAGFFEELCFRGFLFGQLFRRARLGFIPAVLVCSVVFSAGHLYQSDDPLTLVGIVATTFAGSVLFAWLFVEWRWNIWLPISLHALMDAAWFMFGAGQNAAGGRQANVFRGLTIALVIVATIVRKRRLGEPWFVHRGNLWWPRTDVAATPATQVA